MPLDPVKQTDAEVELAPGVREQRAAEQAAREERKRAAVEAIKQLMQQNGVMSC